MLPSASCVLFARGQLPCTRHSRACPREGGERRAAGTGLHAAGSLPHHEEHEGTPHNPSLRGDRPADDAAISFYTRPRTTRLPRFARNDDGNVHESSSLKWVLVPAFFRFLYGRVLDPPLRRGRSLPTKSAVAAAEQSAWSCRTKTWRSSTSASRSFPSTLFDQFKGRYLLALPGTPRLLSEMKAYDPIDQLWK